MKSLFRTKHEHLIRLLVTSGTCITFNNIQTSVYVTSCKILELCTMSIIYISDYNLHYRVVVKHNKYKTTFYIGPYTDTAVQTNKVI